MGGTRFAELCSRGDHAPSYIYKIIKEAYDDEDVEI
jgi:hypothetical protein